ncbi:Putative feruloyl esterase B precursor [Sorangium cellulosum So ce56]|uniref:Feruloyl esterase B n=1 Tax=Sorangium cellulosum (strain So ce56) TaxID=448385 RepID=A9F665_SORC5|nr:Putative feruloyl esterase B precursor [Sorangium cellulosum So ce56]
MLAAMLGSVPSAGAATLQQVNDWGVSGLPGDVSMYVYAPDHVAPNPPTLTLVHYSNHTEAIKQWTDVLGVGASPTPTDTGVRLGNHDATRQRWENECGYVVLDAFTSMGGDHGPSDALFPAGYVIPFLGLDKTGPVDPEIEECSGGAGGTGGAGGSGTAGGSGGSSGTR